MKGIYMNYTPDANEVKKELEQKLSRYFGCLPGEATPDQVYQACALTVRDMLSEKYNAFKTEVNRVGAKRVYYMCMEFLVGRSLKNNLHNLGLAEAYQRALSAIGFDLEELYECEPDAGLGNGGLGRLAACFLDSLSSLNYPATGFSICYEYGLFRQKIVDGMQVELPDVWLPGGEVWLIPRTDRVFHVHFGGHVRERWEDGHLRAWTEGAEVVEAVPCDMLISGADSHAVSRLRLWRARDTQSFNMGLFTQGQYLRALEESTGAEIISKVLYPSDNHAEGKLLRLSQQYFLVSASVQNIVRDHIAAYGTADNLAEKAAIHINDTHPALVIPELMRILMDEHRFSWEKAWDTVVRTCSYTNHTVMPEALEAWNEDLFQLRLPRIYAIVKEINERFSRDAWNAYLGNWNRVSHMSVRAYGQIRMANLSVIGSHCVNGVSKLHTEILKTSLFRDFYKMDPERFQNVTNGIAHRRWLCYSNPRLSGLIDELIGDGYRHHPEELAGLKQFAGSPEVLTRLREIKHRNKEDFAVHLARRSGIVLNADSVFDVQIKRMHEYKRQLLNALQIIGLYLELTDHPSLDMQPQTYIFGAKAAPGYQMAKRIIKLLCMLGKEIGGDPKLREKLSVVFLEDYNVSMAEALIPAAEISEQISLAGKEASGTGCMKLMLNGALTIGTMDGANVEMLEEAGADQIYIFGLTSREVEELWTRGYHAGDYYACHERLKRIVDRLNVGFGGESFADIAAYLTAGQHGIADPYMCLADFESYRKTHDRMISDYADQEAWSRRSLLNIASAGWFSADRSIRTYAEKIWGLQPVPEPSPEES